MGNYCKKKIRASGSKCWLVNTGWTGGPHGVGKRMPINVTRAVLSAALEGPIIDGGFRIDENFGFEVPLSIDGINQMLLTPRNTWPETSDYDEQAQKLVKMFSDNFKRYKETVDQAILAVAL